MLDAGSYSPRFIDSRLLFMCIVTRTGFAPRRASRCYTLLFIRFTQASRLGG